MSAYMNITPEQQALSNALLNTRTWLQETLHLAALVAPHPTELQEILRLAQELAMNLSSGVVSLNLDASSTQTDQST